MRVPTRGAAHPPAPYTDIELCFDAEPGQVSLARSVAAEIAQGEGARPRYVEKVRQVAGSVAAALVLLADDGTQVRCLFRVLESEIRLSFSVRGRDRPSPEAKSEHARLLDQLIVSTSTITVPNDLGGFDVVSDAFIPYYD